MAQCYERLGLYPSPCSAHFFCPHGSKMAASNQWLFISNLQQKKVSPPTKEYESSLLVRLDQLMALAHPQKRGMTLIDFNQWFSNFYSHIHSWSFWEPGTLLEKQIVVLYSSFIKSEMLELESRIWVLANLPYIIKYIFHVFHVHVLGYVKSTPRDGKGVDTWTKLALC